MLPCIVCAFVFSGTSRTTPETLEFPSRKCALSKTASMRPADHRPKTQRSCFWTLVLKTSLMHHHDRSCWSTFVVLKISTCQVGAPRGCLSIAGTTRPGAMLVARLCRCALHETACVVNLPCFGTCVGVVAGSIDGPATTRSNAFQSSRKTKHGEAHG